MKEVTKKEINKILQVILFLVISIIFVLPYLVQISTYFHEKAHQKYLTKYGVENFYQLKGIHDKWESYSNSIGFYILRK